MEIRTTEMHTYGEPLRIIEEGYPRLQATTILDKMQEARENHDGIRQCLMLEPRGHEAMYGTILCEPTNEYPEADLTVLFMHNTGYSTMCGHAMVSLTRYARDRGKGKTNSSGQTLVNIHCPCGLVPCTVSPDGFTTFKSVTSWVVDTGLSISLLGKTVEVDVAFGGAFYVILDCTQLGIDVKTEAVQDLIQLGDDAKKAAAAVCELRHPAGSEMEFMYGTILTDGRENDENQQVGHRTVNLVVFADRQVDRSPCGSGSTARLALMYYKKQVKMKEACKISNAKLSSTCFDCRVVEETDVMVPGETTSRQAVRVEVTGKGYYTGTSVFTVENDDPLKSGFTIN